MCTYWEKERKELKLYCTYTYSYWYKSYAARERERERKAIFSRFFCRRLAWTRAMKAKAYIRLLRFVFTIFYTLCVTCSLCVGNNVYRQEGFACFFLVYVHAKVLHVQVRMYVFCTKRTARCTQTTVIVKTRKRALGKYWICANQKQRRIVETRRTWRRIRYHTKANVILVVSYRIVSNLTFSLSVVFGLFARKRDEYRIIRSLGIVYIFLMFVLF